MKIEVGDVIQTRSGNLFEIKANGTYINFEKGMWLDVAEAGLKKEEIIAVYRKYDQNTYGKQVLKEVKSILVEAIQSLENNEKVNGLGWAVEKINEVMGRV